MHRSLITLLWFWGAGGLVAAPATAAALPRLRVCLSISPSLDLTRSEAQRMVAEVEAIWRPLGVEVVERERGDECDRRVRVAAASEAGAGAAAPRQAMAWVPFVAGRARQIVFLRLERVRALLDAEQRSDRPEGLRDLLQVRMLGRCVAHELGHLLLDSTTHTPAGLMRGQFRPHDALRHRSSYTLTGAERGRLAARLGAAPLVAP